MRPRDASNEHEYGDACCPVCGSDTLGDALTSGADIRFCSRCNWCRVEAPDGQVEKETPPSRSAA